jgi:hypothetical protein
MSFFLNDTNGYLGDFSTHQGIRDIMAKPDLTALNQFINDGEADYALCRRIVKELDASGDLEAAALFAKAQPPVTLEDGVEAEP